MSTSTTLAVSETIWLCPRPLARSPGRFPLIPLLPDKAARAFLPSELWECVLEYVFAQYNARDAGPEQDVVAMKLGLLRVSKSFNTVALPLFYAFIQAPSLRVLEKLAARLHAADKTWDSIRRIPYSAPGRWIHTLNLEHLRCTSSEDVLRLDTVLNKLFPVVPFLTDLILNPHAMLSRRAVSSLTHRDGIQNMRSLKGIQLTTSMRTEEDLFVELLRACTRLEELEVMGTGIDQSELSWLDTRPVEPPSFYPLRLPFLRKLVALSMPSSPVLFALLYSPLPALRHLTLTPYDEVSVPGCLVPRFLAVHGQHLTSLHLYTVKQWPTILFPTPATLLDICPALKHVSLELPLPTLTLSQAEQHHLEILSIPRPKPEYFVVLEKLLPKLPRLRFVRARDVKWLRNGMSTKAQQAGVQGEMLLWRRKLGRRGIQLLDAEWNPGTEGT
ncbi:hypothetical protein BD311DRAFT_784103 [Dichomitus squalens]|uniref:F-box domain-containing protein n=1 Tax=Dichomitus squalens TaxID=114155 RepID=A0A4Q9N1V1_9APHY|nr:hypothetical protein BD311DRAFT_784103 [Dichomitus squalens]